MYRMSSQSDWVSFATKFAGDFPKQKLTFFENGFNRTKNIMYLQTRLSKFSNKRLPLTIFGVC